MTNKYDLAARKAAIRRLKKILALSQSSTPGEAAAALHQAQTIMATFGITDDDLALAEVKEASIKLSSCDPVVWESALVEVVYKSLGVQALCKSTRPTPGLTRGRASVVFVGDGCRAEIASYAFETLRRQLKRDLECSFGELVSQYSGVSATGVKKLKIQPRWREQYALGWCATLKSKLAALMETSPSNAVAQYCESKLTTTTAAKEKRASVPRRSRDGDPIAAYMALQGMRDGKGAVLHRGLPGSGSVLAIN